MRLGRDVEVRLLLLGLLLQVLLVLGSTVLEPIIDLLDADAQVHGYRSFDVGVGLCARLKLRFEIRRVLSRKALLLAVSGRWRSSEALTDFRSGIIYGARVTLG
jgi:hypothetical protein